MKARLKLVGLVSSLIVLLVFTSQFQVISADEDGVAGVNGKIGKKSEKKKRLKVQKATVNLDKSDQEEERKKNPTELDQEKKTGREQMFEDKLNGNSKDSFRAISTASGEGYYKVIVDNNLFRPLGWRPPNNKPRYMLIGTWISSNGVTAKALILEKRSNQTYYVSVGEKVGQSTVESIESNQVSLDLSGDIKMVKSEPMQFLSGDEKGRRRGGKGEKSKSNGEVREDGDRKRDRRSAGERGRGSRRGGGNREEWRGAVERYRNASPEEQQKMREQFMQRMRERGGGRGRGSWGGRGR